jgi:hypothetical protein
MTVFAEVEAFVDDYIARWNAYDVPRLRSLWDATEADPIYVAEEADPLFGWAALEKYWSVDRSTSERLIKYWDLKVRVVAPDIAIAFYQMSWNVYLRNVRLYPRPIGGQVRVSAHLRRKPDGWRLFHYVEAPLAAMIQVRRAHEAAVAPEFLERLAQKGLAL